MQPSSVIQTQFLSVQDVAGLVSRVGTATALRHLADSIRADYLRWPDFDKCTRVATGIPELLSELTLTTALRPTVCPGKTELHPDVLRRAAVFVQYEPQTRIEGDLQHLPADFAVTELWPVLARQAPGRTSAAQATEPELAVAA
jgi:ornithine cyclodeaminase/alanine dehydrogenase-like protein (mu-crystallin family)